MLFFLLFINPLLSIVYFLKKRKLNISKYYLYLSLLIAIIAMGMPVSVHSDLSRHYYRYEHVNTNISIIEYLQGQKDFFIHIIYYYGKKLALKKEMMTLIFVFLSMFFFLKSYFMSVKVTKEKIKYNNVVFLCFFMSLYFAEIIYGLRNQLAIATFLYGTCLLLNRKKSGIFFYIFSCCIHYSALIYICLYILFKFFKHKTKFFKFLFNISLLFICIPTRLIQSCLTIIISKLPLEIFKTGIDFYVNGYWGLDYIADMSIFGKIYMYLLLLKYLWLFLYIKYFCLNKKLNIWKKLLIFLSAFVFILFPMPHLRERYIDLPYLLSIILFAKEKYLKKKYLFILLFISLILCFINLYRIRIFLYEGLIKLLNPTLYNLIYDSIQYFN